MAYSFVCRDLGHDCPAAFIADFREELQEHAELHAFKAHPDVPMDESTYHRVQALMKVV